MDFYKQVGIGAFSFFSFFYSFFVGDYHNDFS